MRRDEDPNRPEQPAREEGDEATPSERGDAGGDDDQEAMEPDLGNAG